MRKMLAGAACGWLLLLVLASPIDAAAGQPTVPVPTAARLTLLISTFDTFNRAGMIDNQNVAAGLRAKLTRSQSLLAGSGTPAQAQAALQSFVDEITGQSHHHVNKTSADTLVALANGAPPPTQFTVAPSTTAPTTVATAVTTTTTTATTTNPVVITVPPATNVSSLTVTAPPPNTPLPTPPAGGTTLVATVVTATYSTGTSLSAPATVSSTFTPPPGVNPLSAAIYTLDATGNTQKLPSTVTKNADGTYTVTAQTPHFSPFVTMGSAPTITSVTPLYAPQAGGTAIAIHGAGFTGADTVTFGAQSVSITPSLSDTDITVTSPAEAPATVGVSVSVPAVGASNVVPGFVYYAPLVAGAAFAPTTVYTGNTVTLSASASGGYPGADTWLWTFDDGTTSTAQNPTRTFNTPGAFTETLKATDSIGNASTTTTTVTVVLPTISGKVTDAASNPVAGDTVSVWNCVQVPGDGCSSLTQVASTTTAGDGTYSVAVANGASYRVNFAQTPTLAEQWYPNVFRAGKGTNVTVSGAPVTGINASLPAGHQVSGTVTDGTNPVPNVNVAAAIATGGCCQPGPFTTTDATGAYALTLPDGAYRLNFGPPAGLLPAVLPITMSGAPKPGTNVALTAGDIISGTVTYNGSGLGNVCVQAFDSATGQGVAGACTDGGGLYQVTIPKGSTSYDLLFQPYCACSAAPQWYPGVSSLTQATAVGHPLANVNITLPTGFHVTGNVGNGTTGLSGIPVNVFDPATAGRCCFGPFTGAQTDSSGNYSLVVPSGSWLVQFNGPNSQKYLGQWWKNASNPNAATPIPVSADVPNISATLQPGFYVSGTVTGTGGAPLGGIDVAALTPGCCGPNFVSGTQTNPDGTYQLLVPSGTYILGFNQKQQQGYMPIYSGGSLTQGGASPVTVTTDLPRQDANLQAGHPISGTVLGANGVPLQGINVNAGDANAGKGGYNTGIQTDQQGNYTLLVPLGTFNVTFNPDERQGYLSQDYSGNPITIDAAHPSASNVSATLQAGIPISGTITDANGNPLGGAPVTATPGCGKGCSNKAFFTQTGPDGTYTVLVAPGTYLVGSQPAFNVPDLNTWYGETPDQLAATPVTVAPGQPATKIDIKLLQNYTITGTVTDATTNAPLPNVQLGLSGLNPDGSCCFGAGGAQTDQNGHYTMAAPNGSWTIDVFDPNHVHASRTFTISGGATSQDFALQTGFSVSGVITAGGAPAGGVNVSFNAANRDGSCCGAFVGGTQTNPDGTYSLALANGTYWAFVNAPPNFVSVNQQVVVNGANQTLSLDLKPGFAVSGKVANSAGAGIANVNVNISLPDANGNCCGAFAGGGQTDGSGNYSITVANGTYLLSFNPPSPYVTPQPTAITVAGGPLTQNVTLQTGFTVSGTVTAGGKAAPNIGVGFNFPNAQGQCCGGNAGGAQTDANGNYSVTVASGTYIVFVGFGSAPPGFVQVQTTVTVNNSNATLNVDLPAGFAVSGTVTNAAGTKLPNAPINLNAANTDGTCCKPNAGFGTQTDANGFYSATVTPGLWYVQFGPSGTYAAYNTTVNVTAATTLNATLPQGYTVSGTLTDPANHPIAGAGVGFNLANADGSCCGQFVAGAQTDANGNYSVTLASGHYYGFFGPAPGFASAQIVFTVGSTALTENATLQPAYAVTGKVTDSSNQPIAGVNVNFATLFADGSCCAPGGAGAQTDANGNYSLNLASATYQVNFNPPAGFLGSQATLTVSGAPTSLNATLQKGTIVSGKVTGPTGTAVQGVNVQVYPTGGCCSQFNALTDSSGSYTLTLPNGSWRFQFSPPAATGLAPQFYDTTPTGTALPSHAVAVTTSGTAITINAALQNGVTITGQVVSSPGHGIPGDWVNALDPAIIDVCCSIPPVASTRTDAGGNYTLVVPAGSWLVQVGNDPTNTYVGQYYGGVYTANLSPLVAGGASGINATLAPGYLVSGTVTAAGGGPLAGASIGVCSTNGVTTGCTAGFAAGATTGANGTYSLLLPNGAFDLFFGPAAGYLTVIQPITVNGAALTVNQALQPATTISGRVTDGAGHPLSGVQVEAGSSTGGCCFSNGTDANGNYTITVPNGTYTVHFTPAPSSGLMPVYYGGVATAGGATPVPVNGTAVSNINATLPAGTTISGTVTGTDTLAGIGNVYVSAHYPGDPWWVPAIAHATTHADGTYTMAAPGGSVTVYFNPQTQPTGYLAGTPVTVNGGGANVNAAVQPGYMVSGKVTDSVTNAGIAGVNVYASPGPGNTNTDAGGNYAMMVPVGSTQTFTFNPPAPYVAATTAPTAITGPTTLNQALHT